MNKKNLLSIFAVLLAAFSIQAQEPVFNWFDAVIDKNSVTPYYLETNDEGQVFSAINFVSLSPNLEAEFLGKTFTGAPNNATSGNRNMLLTKSDISGNLIWGINSIMGDVDLSASAVVPTNDGGVFLALKARHTNRNQHGNDTLVGIIDASGTISAALWVYPSWTYQPVLAKVSADGDVEWIKHIPVDHTPMANASSTYSTYTPDGFYFYSGTTDADGNLYIAGNIRKAMAFGLDTIKAHNVAEWTGDSQSTVGNSFIVKLDEDGNYLAQFTSGGSSVYDNIGEIAFKDDALYMGGLIKGNGEAATFGSFSITTPQQVNLYAAKMSTDLTADWVQFYPGIPELSKNVIQLKGLTVDEESMYLVGGLNGGLGYTQDATESGIKSGGAVLNGFTLQCALEDGTCSGGAIRSSTAIGVAFGVVASADSVFMFGYDWGGNGHNIYLNSYDKDLTAVTQYPLLSGGGMATAWSIVALEDTIVVATRCAKNSAVSFMGTEETFTAPDNWAGLVSSFVFPGRKFTVVEDENKPNSMDDVQITNILCYGSTDGIIVKSGVYKENVSIYNINGMQVKQITVSEGITKIEVPAGMYIIEGQKVIVF